MIVERSQRRVLYLWDIEPIEIRTRLYHPRWLVFEPRLVRGHLSCLRGSHAGEVLLALPSFPGELMVVPHTHKGPASTRVLQVRIRKIAAIQRAIIFNGYGDVKVTNLFALRVANHIAQFT